MDKSPLNPWERSLAAEAFARGRFRLGSSFRMGRARGAFCHAGWCQQCKIALKDGRVGLACQMPADLVDQVRTRRPFHVPFALMARVLRPWFHERVVLWPSFLQRCFLFLVRRASGALPLNARIDRPKRSDSAECDVLIVGAGAAGRAAYSALRALNADVMIVDENPSPEDVDTDLSQVFGATALGVYRLAQGGQSVLCALPDGSLRVSFQRLVIASGGYDRLLPVPGNDLPGVIGLEGFEKLVAAGAIPANRTIALYAPASTAARAVEIARRKEIRFAWAAGPEDLPADAARRILDNVTLRSAIGGGQLRAAVFDDGTRLECDILVVGFRQPKYELQIQAGQHARLAGSGAGVSVFGSGAFPMITVGEAGSVIADVAASTRAAITEWYGGRAVSTPVGHHAPMPGCANPASNTIICPCEDVTVGDIHAAVADGFNSIEHVKRRTGAATGPCQGKLCHALILDLLKQVGVPPALPTMRPLVRPVPLATFAGRSDD